MFRNCKTQDELKSLFRKLAMRLHPDYGGSNELMILCKNCYEESVILLKELEKIGKDNEKKPTFYEKTFDDVFDGDERLQIINEILKYANNHPNFKKNFVNSVIDYLEENEHISSGQYNSLVNVYYSFKMDKEKTKE